MAIITEAKWLLMEKLKSLVVVRVTEERLLPAPCAAEIARRLAKTITMVLLSTPRYLASDLIRLQRMTHRPKTTVMLQNLQTEVKTETLSLLAAP